MLLDQILIDGNPFSGALFACEKETILKRDAIEGNLGDPASSTISFSSETIRVSISTLHLESLLKGRPASSKAFSQYEIWHLP